MERGWHSPIARKQAFARPQAVPDFQFAVLYAEAGDTDNAFKYLDRAIESHDPSLVYLAVAPVWDGLRADRRFGQCLERMGLGPRA